MVVANWGAAARASWPILPIPHRAAPPPAVEAAPEPAAPAPTPTPALELPTPAVTATPAHVPAPAAPAAPVLVPATPPAPAKVFPPLAPPTMSHALQFGLAMLAGTGYRGIFPYQEMIDCGQPQKRVCTTRLPTFLDVQPSFGFARHWDVLVDLRFGLERDFTQNRQFAVAPGVRYWVDPEEPTKFFATAQVAYDITPQNDPMLPHNDDLALHNSNGFMFEVMRNFGAYVQVGETIGFVRWLRFEIDAGLGVQARLP
jgi:hypothetical protein